ncbi:MAG: hypothetical protein AB7F43_07820 [Bacteriovoracia bacterium]
MATKTFADVYDVCKSLNSKDLQLTILYSHLLLAARRRKETNYQKPAAAMFMFSAALGEYLEVIFKTNLEHGDPLLGSLLNNKADGKPSSGFFVAAKKYVGVDDSNREACKHFLEKEKAKCFHLFAEPDTDPLKDIKGTLANLTQTQREELMLLLANERSKSNLDGDINKWSK